MDSYSKLYSDIVTSSIWSEDDKTRIVWITILALRDMSGYVPAALPGLANAARVSVEECAAAVAKLEAPDKYSRTPDHEGRRIEKVEGGWIVLNHQKFRERGTSDLQKEQLRQRVKRYRERHANVTPCNATVTVGNDTVTQKTDKDKDKDKDKEENTNTEKNKNVPTARFVRPTPQEVSEYAKSKGINLDGEVFCSFYASKGWLIGKTPMKDWKAAVTGTWKNGTTQGNAEHRNPAITMKLLTELREQRARVYNRHEVNGRIPDSKPEARKEHGELCDKIRELEKQVRMV